MAPYNIGDYVYWVEVVRDEGALSVNLVLRSGRVVSGNFARDVFYVAYFPGDSNSAVHAWVEPPLRVWRERADAETWAEGLAHSMTDRRRYATVTIIDPLGRRRVVSAPPAAGNSQTVAS